MATNKTYLALKKNYGSARLTSKIKYIVIHYTANDGDTAMSNANYFRTAYRGASAHYFVDDNYIVQSVPDNYVAWSVGGSRYSNYKSTGGASLYGSCTNSNSISIEMCDTLKDGTHNVSDGTLANTLELVKTLMSKYNIDTDHVIRHFDVTGKACPAYYVDATSWAKFKALLNGQSLNIDDYSLVFDASYYAQKYSDLSANGIRTETQLFNHFISNGMSEARQAISTFNPVAYRNRYSDLNAAFGDDWKQYYLHFINNGHAEKRAGV